MFYIVEAFAKPYHVPESSAFSASVAMACWKFLTLFLQQALSRETGKGDTGLAKTSGNNERLINGVNSK